jgi:hypothetical protein
MLCLYSGNLTENEAYYPHITLTSLQQFEQGQLLTFSMSFVFLSASQHRDWVFFKLLLKDG